MNVFQFFILSIAVAFCGFTGCSGQRTLPDRFLASGNVTLDGQPLKEGSISFASAGDIASGMAASANIVDGHYEIQVTPGEKSVKINCFIKASGKSEIDAEYVELVPEKYNNKTTLEATVGSEKNEFDYSLTTK